MLMDDVIIFHDRPIRLLVVSRRCDIRLPLGDVYIISSFPP